MKNTIKSVESSLEKYGIKSKKIHWNLSTEKLHKICLAKGLATESSFGALAVNTGKFTGRSPKDRFIVRDDVSSDKVWWGDINLPFDQDDYETLYTKITEHLSKKELYVRDSYACSDERYRINIRVVSELPWVNIFAHNMFLRPEPNELKKIIPEWIILQAPTFLANPIECRTRQENFVILSFKKKTIIIGGTGYPGETKKGIFSALNFILPVYNDILPMHCSANVGDNGETAIFFGLSGTGKTTLSADPNRKLIGDDEHGWTKDNTVFNFEGGCYAKVIDLTYEKEPDIYRAIKRGALLENVVFKEGTNEVDFKDTSITENTRVSYPIYHINNIQRPSIGKNPKNIFFLTADAFGVLPPISKLTPGQAAFHFISGYTAKVAGTETGVTEPQPSFSACFGAPFMPLHPTKYAEMLSKKMKDAQVNIWLINTGWIKGPYGVGSRISLKNTRAMITAVLEGKLNDVIFEQHPIFGLHMPTSCDNVSSELLNPRKTWEDKKAYDIKAVSLANAFHKNFEKFKEYANEEILAGGPLASYRALS